MNVPLRQLPRQEPPEVLERRIRSLLLEGRIRDAHEALEAAGPDAPVDPKLREVLSPPKIKRSDKRDVDRSAEFRWLDANSAQFRGQWVALVGETLVASASSLHVLLSDLKANPPLGKPLIHHLD